MLVSNRQSGETSKMDLRKFQLDGPTSKSSDLSSEKTSKRSIGLPVSWAPNASISMWYCVPGIVAQDFRGREGGHMALRIEQSSQCLVISWRPWCFRARESGFPENSSGRLICAHLEQIPVSSSSDGGGKDLRQHLRKKSRDGIKCSMANEKNRM